MLFQLADDGHQFEFCWYHCRSSSGVGFLCGSADWVRRMFRIFSDSAHNFFASSSCSNSRRVVIGDICFQFIRKSRDGVWLGWGCFRFVFPLLASVFHLSPFPNLSMVCIPLGVPAEVYGF